MYEQPALPPTGEIEELLTLPSVPTSSCPGLTVLPCSVGDPAEIHSSLLPVLPFPHLHAVLKGDRRNAHSLLDLRSIVNSFTPSNMCSSTILSLLWAPVVTKNSKNQ